VKRAAFFLVFLVAAFAGFLLTAVWYLGGSRSSNTSAAGMMGQMMGNQYAYGMTSPMPSYVWAGLAVLLVLIVVGVAGLAYYLTFPEIKTTAAPAETFHETKSASGNPKVEWSVLLRTSKPEEKRVLEVLAAHDGSYLQKFIVKESGLSRLKTHRIVSGFAERGILMVAKSGNTNQVSLAPWLREDAASSGHPEP
jgi:short subunit fatty acids transporter